MANDQIYVLGVLLTILSFPSFVSAYSAGRRPRLALALLVTGGGLVLWIYSKQPNKYGLEQLPDIVLRVISSIVG